MPTASLLPQPPCAPGPSRPHSLRALVAPGCLGQNRLGACYSCPMLGSSLDVLISKQRRKDRTVSSPPTPGDSHFRNHLPVHSGRNPDQGQSTHRACFLFPGDFLCLISGLKARHSRKAAFLLVLSVKEPVARPEEAAIPRRSPLSRAFHPCNPTWTLPRGPLARLTAWESP